MSVGYGLVFVVLAAFAAFAAVLAPEWLLRWPGAAAAISFLLVGIAYFGAGPRLLCKRANGSRFAWAWLVHWPYFGLLTAFSYRLSMLLSCEAAFVQVVPNVFLGRRLTAREAKDVAEGLLAVLDLAAEMPEARPLREVTNYRSLPVLDATAMSLEQLRDAVEWLKTHAAAGPVYVHCALGHGRSALVVAAYLLAINQASDAKGALKQLRELRPGVRLHRSQRKVLDRFAEEAVRE